MQHTITQHYFYYMDIEEGYVIDTKPPGRRIYVCSEENIFRLLTAVTQRQRKSITKHNASLDLSRRSFFHVT